MMRRRSSSRRVFLVAIGLILLAVALATRLSPATGPTGSPGASAGGAPQPGANAGMATGVAAAGSPTTATPGAGGPGSEPTSRLTPTVRPAATPTARPPAPPPAACVSTDQDRYVYGPARLAVQATCLRITGTVQAVRHESDGDFHILIAVDAPYRHLLTPANQGEELGDLVVEPICVHTVTQADAIAICASDPDPLRPPFPSVGERVWMEGRYVFDLDHGGWAELHPLYRWGPA